jgi:hypothetical protein
VAAVSLSVYGTCLATLFLITHRERAHTGSFELSVTARFFPYLLLCFSLTRHRFTMHGGFGYSLSGISRFPM